MQQPFSLCEMLPFSEKQRQKKKKKNCCEDKILSSQHDAQNSASLYSADFHFIILHHEQAFDNLDFCPGILWAKLPLKIVLPAKRARFHVPKLFLKIAKTAKM